MIFQYCVKFVQFSYAHNTPQLILSKVENLTNMFLAHKFYSISWLNSVFFFRKVAKQEPRLVNFQSYDFARTRNDITFCIIARKKQALFVNKKKEVMFLRIIQGLPHTPTKRLFFQTTGDLNSEFTSDLSELLISS